MTHPNWCDPTRCEAGDDSPGSSRAHRSQAVRVEHDGSAGICWTEQRPGGPVEVALTVAARGQPAPVLLLDCDGAASWAKAIAEAACR